MVSYYIWRSISICNVDHLNAIFTIGGYTFYYIIIHNPYYIRKTVTQYSCTVLLKFSKKNVIGDALRKDNVVLIIFN
jgi:hypothetical protein